ncbi:MAG TPA: NAD-dependent dihydropyrimidine dehydrogenase subunit PreA, partial [Pseudomonadota bacterium]|nr:NAD-dependent dihydropyrimidine dehydrogenase subunit PreA [Pseudomonadota bacterium]
SEVKKRYPKNALIVSLMVESKREAWHEIVRRAEDAGADGLELNFGCPHGMSERGMGSAVGQVPDYTCQIVKWVKEVAKTPVIVKLTPNITDITFPARAAEQGGADAVSLINTINSVTGIDLETMTPRPAVHGASAHGGYCGPAVKPIALSMVASVGQTVKIPISGIGGIANWHDAAEFILMGATTVQVCTAVMHHGFRIVLDMIDGLSSYLDRKGLASVSDLVGRSLPTYQRWEQLDLNYRVIADIKQDKCIGCGVCYAACYDGAHQAIAAKPDGRGRSAVQVLEHKCVGCNLCSLVCPVEDCITMKRVDTGSDTRVPWTEYSKNPSLYPHIRSNRHDQ